MINDLENEIWKSIEGYNGRYAISNIGRVKSFSREIPCKSGKLRTTVDKILKEIPNHAGYKTVRLCKDDGGRPILVHRLIGEYFIPNPENKKTINHINGVKTDNRIENLEWATCQENIQHAFSVLKRKVSGAAVGGIKWPEHKKGVNHHRYGKRNENAVRGENHHSSKKVKCDTLGLYFISIKDAADTLGLYASQVSNVLLGNFRQTKGLTFRYI